MHPTPVRAPRPSAVRERYDRLGGALGAASAPAMLALSTTSDNRDSERSDSDDDHPISRARPVARLR